MDYLEVAGTVVGILYLYWEYKASPWLWLASIAMPAIYLMVYWDARLYADFAISIYYIIASVYGLIVWCTGRKQNPSSTLSDKPSASHNSTATPSPSHSETDRKSSGIVPTPRSQILPLCLAAVALTLILGFLLSRFTDSNVPWADGFTTALSIVALWMLSRKYLEQWLVWILVDGAYVILYAYKDLWFTSALYLAYTVTAVFGYFEWRRLSTS